MWPPYAAKRFANMTSPRTAAKPQNPTAQAQYEAKNAVVFFSILPAWKVFSTRVTCWRNQRHALPLRCLGWIQLIRLHAYCPDNM